MRKKITNTMEFTRFVWRGKSNTWLAKHYNVCRNTILRTKRRLLLKGLGKTSRKTEHCIDMKRFKELHNQGWGLRRLEKEFGVCASSFRRMRKRLGLKYSPKRQKMLTADDVADAHKLRKQGKSFSQIGRYLGCSMETARETINGRRRRVAQKSPKLD